MDLSMREYERKHYTFFDYLSDIGGLTGMLIPVFSIILKIWNYNSFDNYVASRLFKIKKPSSEI